MVCLGKRGLCAMPSYAKLNRWFDRQLNFSHLLSARSTPVKSFPPPPSG